MRTLAGLILLTGICACAQQAPDQPQPERRLRTRDEVQATPPPQPTAEPWIVPAGTKIPLQLKQAVSTKNARPGDPIYAQTSFPISIGGRLMIPAGTYVQGTVDSVKRAGRLKGTAELRFHLTSLVFPNGYTLDMTAAIDQVPGGASSTHMDEPGTVKHDSEKGKDLERIGRGASEGGQIGALAGAASGGNVRGLGIGGVTGIAAGTLIGLLARGSDVQFENGTGVEVALTYAIAIDPARVTQSTALPAYSPQ